MKLTMPFFRLKTDQNSGICRTVSGMFPGETTESQLKKEKKQMMSQQRQNIKFTLIELLITIVVITILVGILLPSLNSARKKAEGIACLGNLKNIGHGFQLYADSNEEYFPPIGYTSWSEGKYWHRTLLLGGYFGNRKAEVSVRMSGTVNPGALARMRRGIFLDPGDVNPKTTVPTAVNDFLSYGANRSILSEESSTSSFSHYIRRSNLANGKRCGNSNCSFGVIRKNPSGIYLAGESGKSLERFRITCWADVDESPYDPDSPQFTIAIRHGATANFVFADGRAAAVKIPLTTKRLSFESADPL
jgi:hypothetical protein